MYMRSIGIRESDVVTELVQKYLHLFPDRETTHYLCNVQKCVFYEPGADDGGVLHNAGAVLKGMQPLACHLKRVKLLLGRVIFQRLHGPSRIQRDEGAKLCERT